MSEVTKSRKKNQGMGSESEFQDRSWLVGNGAEWN
jgi:hypothetical protein